MGVYALVFFVYGISLPSVISRVLASLPVILVGAFALWDKFLWHAGLFIKLSRRPYVSGTWQGDLTSYRRDSEDQPVTSKRKIVMVIRQDLTSISLTLISAESRSRSGAAQIVPISSDEFQVQYQYRNEPKLKFRREGSTIHTGGCSIDIGGLRPALIEGEYWTARNTSGSFQIRKVSSDHVNSFEEGMCLANQGEGGL